MAQLTEKMLYGTIGTVVKTIGFIFGILFMVFMFYNVINVPDEYESPNETINTQYQKDQIYADLVYETSKLASKLDLILCDMRTAQPSLFGENDYKDFDMYKDLIIYGDNTLEEANDPGYKVMYLGNMIGNMNYHYDITEEFMDTMNPLEVPTFKHHLAACNDDIEKINKLIHDYNKIYDVDIPNISYLRK